MHSSEIGPVAEAPSLTDDLDREIAALEGQLGDPMSTSGFVILRAKIEALRKLRFAEAPFYRTYE